MRKLIYNIFSITLALLVLFSTFSFTISKHYCMGEVVEISLTGKTNGCAMVAQDEDCDDSKQAIEDDCCSDISEVVESNNDTLKLNDVKFKTLQFSAVFFSTYINLFKELPRNVIPFKDYVPPLLVTDLTVLHDTFLI